jgi:hypothetical protein
VATEPEHASAASSADAEETAITAAVSGTPTPVGYGDRFVEDAFGHPSPSAAHA